MSSLPPFLTPEEAAFHARLPFASIIEALATRSLSCHEPVPGEPRIAKESFVAWMTGSSSVVTEEVTTSGPCAGYTPFLQDGMDPRTTAIYTPDAGSLVLPWPHDPPRKGSMLNLLFEAEELGKMQASVLRARPEGVLDCGFAAQGESLAPLWMKGPIRFTVDGETTIYTLVLPKPPGE